MRVIVYTGTSISTPEAKKILDAEYQPPVRRDDLRSIRGHVDVIGIIDGVFFDRAAVAHREIIEIMNKGTVVVGGSSMGALRAAELAPYGMIGVGTIFGWYRDGVIESDDEVAVTFDPDTLAPLSVPLVNVRATLEAAVSAGVLTDVVASSLISLTRKMFYPDRSYTGILKLGVEAGILSNEQKEKLSGFIREHEVDVKKQDAVLVLEKVGEIAGAK